MNHGLTDETLAEIHRVLALRHAVEKAVLYGSRAKGTHRPGSDIDLALVGDGLDNRIVSQIADDFEEGPLPYRVDLSILKEIRHLPLKDPIRRAGVVLYEKESADVTPRGS